MENIRTIILHSREVTKEKQSFIASVAEINGKWYKIKFTKECERTPKKRGLYDLTINIDDCSIESGKTYIDRYGELKLDNSTIWVKNVIELRPYTEEELKSINRAAFSGVFGE